MKVYHMSDTLPLNAELTADYKQTSELIQPFVQALERGEDCFFGALMAAKHQKAVLRKFGLQDMWTNYIKWATEAIFEFIRKQEFPESCSRITGNYFFDHLESCRELFEADWGMRPGKSAQKSTYMRWNWRMRIPNHWTCECSMKLLTPCGKKKILVPQ